MRTRLTGLPMAHLTLAAGILILGFSTYAFLLIAGRELGDERYAPLGAMWMLVFLSCPGLFFPVEQELGRAIAARRARAMGAGPILRAAIRVVVIAVILLSVVALVCSGPLSRELFNGQWMLQLGLITCIASFASMYIVRGVFAGGDRLAGYGIVVAAEGVFRVVGAIVLALIDVQTAGPYGLIVGLAPFASVAVALMIGRGMGHFAAGPVAELRELTASLGTLVIASLLSQTLVNAAPLVVKYRADATQQAFSGAFTKAVILTRIPLFLFQAVQAAMLPRLTHHATRREHAAFRSTLRVVVLGVVAIGLLGVGAAAAFGDFALRIFGSDVELARSDITLLAAGNAVVMLCMTFAQALIAVKGQRDTLIGWFAGLAVFVVACLIPGDNVMRHVEIGLLAGAGLTALVMLVLLARRLRHLAEPDSNALLDALRPDHEGAANF